MSSTDTANKITVRELTGDEIAEFRREGFVHLPDFVDHGTVDRLLADADAQVSDPGPYGTNMTTDGVFYQDREMYQHRPAFNDYVMASNLAEQAGRAMGSQEVRFYFDHLFALAPNTAKDQHYWHQDQPYWGALGDEICSFWLALTDCADDSGALEFVRGTDKGPFYLPVGFGEGLKPLMAIQMPSENSQIAIGRANDSAGLDSAGGRGALALSTVLSGSASQLVGTL